MEIAQEVLSKLGFDWQVALANLLNFLIIYFLLKKVIFDRLAGAIAERKIKAEANVSLRAELDEEKLALEKLAQEKEREIRNEKDRILSLAQKEKHDILDGASKEAQSIKEKAITDAEKEKQKIVNSLSDEIKDLSLSLSQKVLSAYQEKPDTEKLKSILDKQEK